MIVCKGWCDSKKDNKRPSDPFATSSYCKRCNWWLPKQSDNKCPCCHGLVRTRPRHTRQRAARRAKHVKRT